MQTTWDAYTANILDVNADGNYELTLCPEDMAAVYKALKAAGQADPDGLVAAVAYALEEAAIEEDEEIAGYLGE